MSALYHDIIAILYENTPIKIDIMNSERIEYRLHYYLPTKIYVFTVYRRFLLRNLPSIYHIITLLLTLNVYTTQGKSISLVRRFNQTNSLVQLFDWTKMILSEENRISIPCHAFYPNFNCYRLSFRKCVFANFTN